MQAPDLSTLNEWAESIEKVISEQAKKVSGTITLYPIGRPVRATITLYPIGRPVRVGNCSNLRICVVLKTLRMASTRVHPWW